MYIPKSKSELVDSLGWMVLQVPDFRLGMGPKIGKDGAFERLRMGIEKVYPDADSDIHKALLSLLGKSRQHTDAREVLEASQCFVDMQKLIRNPSKFLKSQAGNA